MYFVFCMLIISLNTFATYIKFLIVSFIASMDLPIVTTSSV